MFCFCIAVLKLAKNQSIVEITMLLCSQVCVCVCVCVCLCVCVNLCYSSLFSLCLQEWQTALKKTGGKMFSDLLQEGK